MNGRTVRWVVPADAEGERLDRFLSGHVTDRSRSSLLRLIRDGRVRVDGRAASKAGLALREGMRLELALPPPEPDRLEPESIPIEIVHEDEHLVVVAKPAGLVVHPGHGHRTGTLVNALLGRGSRLAPAGGKDRPGIVHRLDRETSGLIVVAKTDEAHRAMAAAFAGRRVRKKYVALVWGRPDPPEGSVERSVGRSRSDPTRMSVRSRSGRPATTRYRTIERLPGFSLLEIDLVTGRTHQIRVHLNSLHHPVVGDARYGGQPWKRLRDAAKREALRSFDRLALHAAELSFAHPASGKEIRFRSPIPDDFNALLCILREAA